MCATRPDIGFAVGIVSKYLETPKLGHWTAVKSIPRYLRGTKRMNFNLIQVIELTSSVTPMLIGLVMLLINR